MNKLLSVFMLVIFLCGQTKDAVIESDYNNHQTELQRIVDEQWNNYANTKPNLPGGYALQIIKGDDDYYAAAGELKSSTNQIHFRGASTTKTFTAAGILLLYQRGLLNINASITDTIPGKSKTYVPDTEAFDIPYKNEITIKLLLQNRAGVFDLINSVIPDSVEAPYAGQKYTDYVEEVLMEPTHTFSTEEMAELLAKHKLCYFKPGEKFHYSDTGFNLLGYIIERVSGESYSDFITKNLLIPNKLTETTFPSLGSDVDLPQKFAPGYFYSQGEIFDATASNRSKHIAEGNVITTPHDLTMWMKKLLKGESGIERKYIEFLMKDCQPTYEAHNNYGLGCVFTPKLGFGHNGGTAGYWTVARYDPEMDLAFTLFCNVWDFDAMSFDLYKQLFEMYDLALKAKELFE